jgi:hypothetical protein
MRRHEREWQKCLEKRPLWRNCSSLDVLLTTGEVRTLMPEREPQLFHACVGSIGIYILGPSNHLQADVPAENVLMLFKSAHDWEDIPSSFDNGHGFGKGERLFVLQGPHSLVINLLQKCFWPVIL